jgi:transposase-like protein
MAKKTDRAPSQVRVVNVSLETYNKLVVVQENYKNQHIRRSIPSLVEEILSNHLAGLDVPENEEKTGKLS